MELRSLGTSEIRISPIIMGTWQAGKEMWVGIDDKESIAAIRAAFDAGITTFDTAEAYGNGHSEKMVAAALSDVRKQVIIATKVFSNHLKYDQVIAACDRSLKNLNTDYIDLYQIHWPPGSFGGQKVPVEEPLKALNELKAQGKIRAIGVSNFSRAQLEQAAEHADIVSLQPPFSLFWRKIEKDAAAYCREHDITILAYSAMAQGLLTGKFGPDHHFVKGDHRSANILFQPNHYQRVQQALDMLRPIAAANHITLAQLALSWVISQSGVCAIAGARSVRQAVENAAAADVRLSDADLAAVDKIGRRVTDHLDDRPVMWKF